MEGSKKSFGIRHFSLIWLYVCCWNSGAKWNSTHTTYCVSIVKKAVNVLTYNLLGAKKSEHNVKVNCNLMMRNIFWLHIESQFVINVHWLYKVFLSIVETFLYSHVRCTIQKLFFFALASIFFVSVALPLQAAWWLYRRVQIIFGDDGACLCFVECW